jgi:hypoxanthine phosphoribosyltransferase
MMPLLLAVTSCLSASSEPIQIEERSFEMLISSEEIEEKIASVAKAIDIEYAGKDLAIVMVMKGSVCLAADLIRHIHVPCTLEFVRAQSYGLRGEKRGDLTITGVDNADIAGKDVLLIDDIFDTGNTLTQVSARLNDLGPKSLKTLVLLVKNVPHVTPKLPDYVLFDIEDRFVIGYGLDYKEMYRGLPAIYVFSQDGS